MSGPTTSTTLNTIILAEDDAVRRSLADALAARKHTVLSCTSARQASKALSRSAAELLVVQWPGRDGGTAGVCTRAAAATPSGVTVVLAVVDSANPDELGKAISSGAADVITWPVSQELLDTRLAVVEARVRELRDARSRANELRAAQERIVAISAGAADGLWDWDIASGQAHFSTRWKEILGYGELEVADDPDEWLSRIHADDARLVRERLDWHLRGQVPECEVEHRVQRKDGSYAWVVVRGVAVRDDSGKACRLAGSLTDVSARKASEAQLMRDVSHDPLTGLPNRARFMDRLQRVFERARRRNASPFAVLFLDVDRFKLVNDSLGHMAGDRLLVGIARRLEDSIRPIDTVARLGGDEFAIVLEGVEDPREATVVADRIQKSLRLPFEVGGQEVYTTVSIGIAQQTGGYQKAEELLRDADTAMYRAKTLGRDRYAVFDRGMHEKVVADLQLENDLRRALGSQAFMAYYQPIIALEDGRIVGLEALVRWNHPQRGVILPGEFVHVAEETGLIIPIDRWMAGEACHQLRAWQVQFRRNPPLTMSINVSGAQFMQPDLPMQIDRILRDCGLWGTTVKLEITESVIMEKARYTGPMLEHLRGLAIRVSIDDFGTGYSSLSYLRRFEIDSLKIDSSFVAKMTHDEESAEIVRAIVSLARNLGKDIVAEGVETASQLARLREMGCTCAQGFYFSKPLAADAATKLLAADPRW